MSFETISQKAYSPDPVGVTISHRSDISPIQELDDSEIDSILEWTDSICSDEVRLMSVSEQISTTINRAVSEGHYILPRTPIEIAQKIKNGMGTVIPGQYSDGSDTFQYFWGMSNIVVEEFFQEFPVVEGGSLIANPRKNEIIGDSSHRSSHAIQIANRSNAIPADSLIINTSRSFESKRACLRAGSIMIKRSLFPMLDALTCDPGCLPGSDGSVAGVYNVINRSHGDCIACPVNEAFSTISDSCYLLTPDPERALVVEKKLAEYFKGSATAARSALVEGTIN